MIRAAARALLVLLALSGAARAQAPAAGANTPQLTADLSTDRVEITTGFTGSSVMVFGATERLIGPESGEDVVIVASGPPQATVVRRKVNVLGFWLNGPSAVFREVPGFYAIAATRPVHLLRPIPEMPADVPRSLARAARLGCTLDMVTPLTAYHQRHALVWAAQDKAQADCGAHVLEPLVLPVRQRRLPCHGWHRAALLRRQPLERGRQQAVDTAFQLN